MLDIHSLFYFACDLADEYIQNLRLEFIRLHDKGEAGLRRVKSLYELISVSEGDVLRSMRTLLWNVYGDTGSTISKEDLDKKDLNQCKALVGALEEKYGGRDLDANLKQLKEIRSLYSEIPNKSPLALATLQGSANIIKLLPSHLKPLTATNILSSPRD